MDINGTSVCSAQEICNIGTTGAADGLKTLKEFCQKALPYQGGYQKLYSFYIFSEAIRHDGTAQYSQYGNYGKAFAKVLKDLDLGEVLETKIKKNKAFHPDYSNIFWIWGPDEDKLKAWWKENNPRGEADKKAQERIRLAAEKVKVRNEPKPIAPVIQAPIVVDVPKPKRKLLRKKKVVDPLLDPIKPKKKLLKKKLVPRGVFGFYDYR